MPDLRDHRALITGASSGIGREMARVLASWGCALTITARRGERLRELADELRAAHGVAVRCVICDLGQPGGAATLYEGVQSAGEKIDILVNNAGAGRYQAFEHQSWDELAGMIQLDVTSLVELTHRFLPEMRRSTRRAYVLNVASIAAYQPVPYFACYAAAKSYVRDFSEALAAELERSNVSVSCLCPGGTRTEFSDLAGQTLGRLAEASMLEARTVAEKGLLAMLRGRRNRVTGWMNVLSCFLVRFVPRRVAAASAALVLGPPRGQAAGSERA
ncbi:MAG TPA: SDR family oxidoreductase [Haliangium sp.]|nr:SDR family oxidoreductase [Haliangium sp.]